MKRLPPFFEILFLVVIIAIILIGFSATSDKFICIDRQGNPISKEDIPDGFVSPELQERMALYSDAGWWKDEEFEDKLRAIEEKYENEPEFSLPSIVMECKFKETR